MKVPVISLTVHWLRFTVRAETDIHFHAFAGSALRGALAGVLTRQYCPEWRNGTPDPLHRQLCPVCQLLGWEHRDIEGGDVRRPYALIPPLDPRTGYGRGESFSFTLTLLGERVQLLPYLILGVGAMGETGLGRADRTGQRGRFVVTAVDAINPLTRASRALVESGAATVRLETLPVTHDQVMASARQLADKQRIRLQFQTPLRLNQEGRLVKVPAFFPLAKQIALRLLDLCAQHGTGRPDVRLKETLYPYADQVSLIEDKTRWCEVAGYSQRLGRRQQLSGLLGEAVYAAPDWQPLLPWLIWGQVVQVGKNTVKGCGVYTLTPVTAG